MRLYLIRHGETEWSLAGRHTSRTDVSLTEQGEQDARKVGERLRAAGFTRVFTSPRQRARRTSALAGLTPVAEIEPDLAEWDYGDYEGQQSGDIRKGRPDWNLFRDNVALFSHGHFGRVLAVRWIGLPVIKGQNFLLGTASLSIVGCEPNHPEVPVIALWNS